MTAEAPAPALSRDQVRSRRPYQHRSRTIRVRQMTKLSIEIGRQLFPETDHRRPQTRAEMARHVRHVRRKGVPAMRLPDGVREVVVSPEPPEAEGEEVAA